MNAYCEQHPFATQSEGKWREGLNYTASQTQDYWLSMPDVCSDSAATVAYWRNQFDWLIKIQPLNTEYVYQERVISGMAEEASFFDWNLECNLFYNYTLIFPSDSGGCKFAWEQITQTRERQGRVPQDTTPFTVLKFPLKPYTSSLVTKAPNSLPGKLAVEVNPNPTKGIFLLHLSLAERNLVRITVLDMLGREVRHLPLQDMSAGTQTLPMDLLDLAVGRYFLRVSSEVDVVTTPLLIQR